MYGTGGRLLSGIPVHTLGSVTKESLETEKKVEKSNKTAIEVMPFGKYKGEPVKVIPKDYKLWMIENFEWGSHNENLRKAILTTI
jgi:DNA repair protein RadD